MTVATKTKTTKVDSLYPPSEIRDNTKARRAWLAEKLAEVNGRAGFSGKIVGNGSYQSVSVYSVTEVAGRLRHRGHCQFCGNSQVVDGGVMVLHGYTRPGDGYIFNECPCVRRAPLEADQHLTEMYLNDSRNTFALLSRDLEEAKKDHSAALEAKYADNESREPNGYTERPHGTRRHATEEEVKAYRAAMKQWAKKFPLTAALEAASARESELNNLVWRAKQQVQHFETLLGMKLLGKPLIEEVVA